MTQRDVVRDVVGETAPHELVLLDGLDSLDDERVTRLMMRRCGRDPVGFGVTDVTALVTPVVWLAVAEVVRRGSGAAADSLFSRLRGLVRRLLRRRSPAASRSIPPLTGEQLDAVHAGVLDRAAAAGIDRETAEQVADALVSRLARLPASRAEPGSPDGGGD